MDSGWEGANVEQSVKASRENHRECSDKRERKKESPGETAGIENAVAETETIETTHQEVPLQVSKEEEEKLNEGDLCR